MAEKCILGLAKRFNNFLLSDPTGYLPFLCNRQQVGLISPQVLSIIRRTPELFQVGEGWVSLSDQLTSYERRSEALAGYLETCRRADTFLSLRGWRSECYEVRTSFSDKPLFKVERSATPIFGFRQYGVHINGMVQSRGETSLWLQRRSDTKPTFPGKLDTFVGGGFSEGRTVHDTAVKEIEEEAGLRLQAPLRLRPAGSVSFFYQSEKGLYPQTEFVYDLELPVEFIPDNTDGEVASFQLVKATELLDILLSEDYKVTSVPIALDWLVRHGFLTVEIEPDLPSLVEAIHTPLHTIYNHNGRRPVFF